jgi:cysteine desulfurase/selenocysteine lyase
MNIDDDNLDPLDVNQIRKDFPALGRNIKPGIPLVYLDSTATSQKPLQVINKLEDMYKYHTANIHRGIHTLAEEATREYELAREKITAYINAPSTREVVFTRNATESINLVAYTWGRKFLQPGDIIVLTEMEHHSNLIPWQILAEERNLRLEFITITDDGKLDLESYYRLLELKPKLVSFTHMSNVLGTINPAKEIIKLAHEINAVALVDGAQSVPHFPVDVQDLGADFLAFSGHKMLGPSGIGVLYGKKALLEAMPPFLGGGEMIKRVELRSFKTNALPHKFEAGTPAIAEAVGLGAAVDYINQIGISKIAQHDHRIGDYALERLEEIPGVRVYGPEMDAKGAVFSFTLAGVHPHDASEILDLYGIAVRAGHHCAMPLHNKLKLPATIRASFYLYNNLDEVDKLVDALYKVKEVYN